MTSPADQVTPGPDPALAAAVLDAMTFAAWPLRGMPLTARDAAAAALAATGRVLAERLRTEAFEKRDRAKRSKSSPAAHLRFEAHLDDERAIWVERLCGVSPEGAPDADEAGDGRCKRTLGERPSWMSEDQYDASGGPCRCLLPADHDGLCQCEHTKPEPPPEGAPGEGSGS